MATLASKRKRESNDIPHPRAAPALSEPDTGLVQYLHGADDDDDGMGHDDHDMGFALAQHNAGLDGNVNMHHDQDHNPGQEQGNPNAGQSASDTAAAAMAQYHTMTVPQSTEQAFLAQANEGSNDRPGSSSVDGGNPQRNSSFGDFDIIASKNDQPPSNGADGSPGGGNSANKPPVGTEEWHKQRRDNHKEGESKV